VGKFVKKYSTFIYTLIYVALTIAIYCLRYAYPIPIAGHLWDATLAVFRKGPPISEASYDNFFALMGTADIALWIGAFAVVALSRYRTPTASATASRTLRKVALGFDVIYNSWMILAFSTLSCLLWSAAALNIIMLLPALNVLVFQTLISAIFAMATLFIVLPFRHAWSKRGPFNDQLDEVGATIKRRHERLDRWAAGKLRRGATPSVKSMERELAVRIWLKKQTKEVGDALGHLKRVDSLFTWATSALSVPRMAAMLFFLVTFLYPSMLWIVTSSICVTLIGALYLLWFANTIALEVSVPSQLSG
jgi:hypothetical protein